MKSKREKCDDIDSAIKERSKEVLTWLSPLLDQLSFIWLREQNLLSNNYVKDVDIKKEEIEELRNKVIEMINDVLGAKR